MPGYHDAALRGKLRADLSEFWPKVEHLADDDPHRVLFMMLASTVAEAYKRFPYADDDDMRASFMAPNIRYAVKVILGIERRQGQE